MVKTLLEVVPWAAIGSWTLHIAIVGGLSIRVISSRRPTGVSLAWLTLLATVPFVGAALYVLVGEAWLSGRRSNRTALVARLLREPIRDLDSRFGVEVEGGHHGAESVAKLGRATGFSPPLGGNAVEILDGAGPTFDRLVADIDAAERSCDLLYYIWTGAGRVREVEDALVRARGRGVTCRVMADAVGGKALLKGDAGRRLRAAGVEVRAALPVGLVRGRFSRVDLRNHRKLAAFDDRVAYTGSLNMADPRAFKVDAGVGAWVDLVARVEGPAAGLLSSVFELDWAMEGPGDPDVEGWVPPAAAAGDEVLQVVPSGPGQRPRTLYRMLSAAVHGARERLILTTPYFVPDDAFVSGLVSAALRGVETAVVVPARVDGPLVGLASRAYYDDLLEAGVKVWAYGGGLLHAKTVTVDDAIGVIGTVNLDRRSFWLNYELSLVVQGGPVVGELRRVQEGYIGESKLVSESAWMRRGRGRRLVENAAQLLSPIL